MPFDKDHIFYGINLTDEQRTYVDSMIDNKVTVVDSVAGTGKTTLAVGVAAILQKKLYYVFSPVEEDKMGFRPGTQEEKENAYIGPLKCALAALNYLPEQCIYSETKAMDPRFAKQQSMNEKAGNIWVYPMSHVFARGINIEDAFVLIDEAQNLTVDELQKVLTRCHDNCTIVLAGHTGQCDLENKSLSGFPPYREFYKTKQYAKVCRLTKNFRGQVSRDADTIKEFINSSAYHQNSIR